MAKLLLRRPTVKSGGAVKHLSDVSASERSLLCPGNAMSDGIWEEDTINGSTWAVKLII